MQEFTAQFRCLKLALESRIGVTLNWNWHVLHLMVVHACCLICRCFRRAHGKTPFGILKGYESSRPIVEFGEQIWAKPLRTKAWSKKASLQARWAAGTWCGISPRTGEHLVVLGEGGSLIRARTVKRRPPEERWDAEGIAKIGARKDALLQS